MSDVSIIEESADSLESYAAVPIAFAVSCRFRVEPVASGLEGFSIVEEPVPDPYLKDYDAITGEGPTRWRRWDLTNWGFLAAFADQRRVGGAIIAWQTEGIDMLEGRADLAVLWDIRVAPDVRGQGVGARLVRHVEQWTLERGYRTLKIGTQNINVPACRFYVRGGCTLGAVFLHAYPELPEEVQMLWYKDLASQA